MPLYCVDLIYSLMFTDELFGFIEQFTEITVLLIYNELHNIIHAFNFLHRYKHQHSTDRYEQLVIYVSTKCRQLKFA